MKRITIVGLGQIGGSMALALRAAAPRLHITGIDISARRLRLLEDVLDASSRKYRDAGTADLTVVCLHFQETIDFLRSFPRGRLIADVCSGKQKVVSYANRRRLRFIGGHPMAGNEKKGEKGWDAGLFRSRPFFVCPGNEASARDLAAMKSLIALLGAKYVRVDPGAHDRYVALSSHLPAFLSIAYRRFTSGVPRVFRGPGYQSMIRLSGTSPELLETFLVSNGPNIRAAWKHWRAFLRREV